MKSSLFDGTGEQGPALEVFYGKYQTLEQSDHFETTSINETVTGVFSFLCLPKHHLSEYLGPETRAHVYGFY